MTERTWFDVEVSYRMSLVDKRMETRKRLIESLLRFIKS
jgi:hypothetical protein